MPYGVSKKHGGDTPENDAKMERCVEHVMDAGKIKDKAVAIAICKHSMFKDDEEDEDEDESEDMD